MKHTACATLLGASLALFADVAAQRPTPPGIIPLRPGAVQVRSLIARVTIRDGVASTELEQVLYNDGGTDAEADWILPLPEGATADGFTMTVGDKVMTGEVLDGARARAVYEEIVRKRRDPGLLEYHGAGCLRARVFPIPARGEVVAKVRYRHALTPLGGVYGWSFPLRALASNGMAPQRVSLDLDLAASSALKNVFSPWAGVDVRQRDDRHARVSFESQTGGLPSRDLDVFFSLADSEFGLNALTFRRGDEDGYVMLLLSPKREWADDGKSGRLVQFVIDTSGSMAGRKMDQAKAALRFFVRSLGVRDRFNIIPFSTDADPFFASAAEAQGASLETALQKIDKLEARGGTNIEEALRRALTAEVTAPALLPIVVFLTDGEPTVGDTNRPSLLAKAKEHNKQRMRLFVFGVGNSLDAKLLDQLAADNGGSRDYVREDEDIEVKTSALFTKLSHPVLTDLQLNVDGVELRDVHPRALPDLFKGTQLTVLGRYRGSGRHTVRLSGSMGGARQQFSYEVEFPSQATAHDFVPPLWGERKVAQLLDAIQQNGQKPELIEEVRRLAKEFGIVTPFTSHLIVEEGMRLAGGGRGLTIGTPASPGAAAARGGEVLAIVPAAPAAEAEETARDRLLRLGTTDKGSGVVADSRDLAELEKAERKAKNDDRATRRVGTRTFYRVGEKWIDAACKTGWETGTEQIEAFSAAYFKLLTEQPDLKAALALGERVVIAIGARVVEITPAPRG